MHYCETFWRAHAGPAPPVAADRPAGDVGNAFPHNSLIDVSVPLQHAEHVVSFKEINDFVCVRHRQAVMLWLSRWRGHIRTEGRHQRDMNGHYNRRHRCQRLQIGGQPSELRRIDPSFIRPVICYSDGIQNDEMHAFVVERVIRFAEAIFEELLSIQRICGLDAALQIDAKAIVITQRVMELESQILLGLGI